MCTAQQPFFGIRARFGAKSETQNHLKSSHLQTFASFCSSSIPISLVRCCFVKPTERNSIGYEGYGSRIASFFAKVPRKYGRDIVQGMGRSQKHLRHILRRPSRGAPIQASNFLALQLLVSVSDFVFGGKKQGAKANHKSRSRSKKRTGMYFYRCFWRENTKRKEKNTEFTQNDLGRIH